MGKYGDLMDQEGTKPVQQQSRYGTLMDEDDGFQQDTVRQNMFAAKETAPDRKAEAVRLSQQTSIPVSVVEGDFDRVKQEQHLRSVDYRKLSKNYPSLSRWLGDLNNATLAQDDLDSLKKLEDTVKDHSMLETLGVSVKSGLASMASGISKIPSLAGDAFSQYQNLKSRGFNTIAEAIGSDARRQTIKTPKGLLDNEIVKGLDDAAKSAHAQVPELSESVWDHIESGNWSRAGRTALAQAVAASPNLGVMLVMGRAGLQAEALAFAGGTTAADAAAENKENPNLSPEAGFANAYAKGAAEAAFEKIGTFLPLKQWEAAISNTAGKAVTREVFKDLFKTLLYTTGMNFTEEALTSGAQDLTDYYTGANPDALKGIAQRMFDAGSVGAVMGAGMVSPGAAAMAIERQAQVRKATQTKNFYTALGESAEATKLRERLPEAQRALVEEITKDSSVENIYIDPNDIETYFQGPNGNPINVMRELGVLEAFETAKESGTDVKIPLGAWVEKIVGTEHYSALADFIKFSPEDLSAKQAAEIQKQVDDQLKQEAEAARLVAESEQEEDSAEVVGETVAAQLEALGVPKESAVLYETGFRSLGERMGIDPLELFKQFNLRISGTQTSDAEMDDQRVFDQTKIAIQGLPGSENVIDATSLFRPKNEETAAPPEDDGVVEQAKKWLGATAKKIESEHGFRMLNALSARYDDKRIDYALRSGQRADLGPYVSMKEMTGIGWAPNFAAKPTGTIGPANISEPASIDRTKGVKGEIDGMRETDPFKWAEDKYGATKILIEKHVTEDVPLTEINTSSDLIGRDDYIALLPHGVTVNMYLLTRDPEVNRALFPGNASLKRQEDAVEKLRAAGVKVNAIRPTFESVVSAVGGESVVEKLLGSWGHSDWKETLRRSIGADLRVLKQSSIRDLDRARLIKEFEAEISKPEKVTQYEADPETMGGKKLDTDIARWLIDRYAKSRENRVRFTPSTQSPAGNFIWNRFVEMLKQPATGDVLLLGGGGASGKSTAFSTNDELADIASRAEIIYDSVMPNLEQAEERIQMALDSGRPVTLAFVYRPIKLAAEGMVERFKRVGRYIPAETLVRDHIDALETFLAIAKKYSDNPAVHTTVYDNTGPEAQTITIDELDALRYIQEGETRESAQARLLPSIKEITREVEQEVTAAQNQQGTDGESSGAGEGSRQGDSEQSEQGSEESSSDPLNQSSDDGPRGQIQIGQNGINISILPTADLSTFFHESGHFYLEVMRDLAARENAPQDIKDDYAAILEWVGAESGAKLSVEQHEMFARGFEAYLMEGKAPSQQLRSMFARFKVWLISVYRQLVNLNVQLTPEVRGVMDRILATAEEIEQAQNQQGMEPLFKDPTAFGMTGEKAERYLRAREEAKQTAEEEIQTKLLNDFNREKEAWWAKQRAEIRSGIIDELNGRRIYRALSIIQRGKLPDDSALPEGMPEIKLSKAALVELYGKDFLKRLPRPYVYSAKGGLHPDVAAELLGFESGDAMVTEMANTPKKDDLADQMADQRMAEAYPDLLNNGQLPLEAMNAVHNEPRAKVLRMELEHLASNDLPALKDVIRKVAKRVPSEKAVREQATRIIGGFKVNELSPILFLRAEARAAKEAGEAVAKGDFDAAFEAKRKELLNHELYRAATKARADVQSAIDRFRSFTKPDEKLAKARDIDLVNAARAILASYGLGRSEAPPEAYLNPIKQYDPDTYQTIEALVSSVLATAGNYKTVKFDDFIAMRDTVDALWDLSKANRQIEIDGQKIDRGQIIDELKVALGNIAGEEKELAGYKRAVSEWDKVKLTLLGARARLRRVESWVDAIDGGEINGAFRRYIWNPISEGVNKYRESKRGVMEQYLSIVKTVEPSLTKNDIPAGEIGYTFKGKQELLGALLHTGNQSNLSKLLRGRGWGEIDDNGNLDTSRWDNFIRRAVAERLITKADYDYVQSVWDLLETLKADAQRAHKQMYGHYFNEITADEILTPFGVYRGGYVPAIADPNIAEDASIREEKASLEKLNNSFMFPTAGRGFTKKRTEMYARPLTLDLGMIPGHIDKVLRFVNIEPRVKEVGRIVMDHSFRRSLEVVDPAVGGAMLVPWLQRAALQKIETPTEGRDGRGFDAFWRALRTRTGLQVMTANVTNAMQQFTGLSIAGLKVEPKYLRDSLWTYMKAPKKTAEAVAEKSAFMRTRMSSQMYEIQNQIDEMLLNPNKYEQAREFAKKHGYFLQSGTQNIVDTIVWSGAYDQAVESGQNELEAVRAADSAVRLTQGSFAAEDVSKFETGSPFMRLFTMFYSYFNMQANLLGTEFSKVSRELGLKKGAGKLFYIYALGFMIPAMISEAIVRAMGNGFDEDDDDEYLDDALKIFFSSQFRNVTAMVPAIGPVAQAGLNATDDKWYNDRISTSPALAMIESAAVGNVANVYDFLTGEDVSTKKATKDFLTLLGLMTGAPLAPLSRPIGYLSGVAEGDIQPSGVIDFTRGLVTGKPGAN